MSTSFTTHKIIQVTIALLMAICLLAIPLFVWAHPLGNFSVNRYSRLELGPKQIELFYVLDMAEIPTFQELPNIDTDGDGTITTTEHDAYLSTLLSAVQSNLHLLMAEQAVPLTVQEHTLDLTEGDGGLQTLRFSASFIAELSPAQNAWQMEYRDDNYVERLGWQEIVVRGSEEVQLLDSSVPTEDITQELRTYPEDLLQSPLSVSQATFSFQLGAAGDGGNLTTESLVPISHPTSDHFTELISNRYVGFGALLLALMVAFGFGAVLRSRLSLG